VVVPSGHECAGPVVCSPVSACTGPDWGFEPPLPLSLAPCELATLGALCRATCVLVSFPVFTGPLRPALITMASLEAYPSTANAAAAGKALAEPATLSATAVIADSATSAPTGADAATSTAGSSTGKEDADTQRRPARSGYADILKKDRSFRSGVEDDETVVFGDSELAAASSRRTAASLYIERPGAKIPTDAETRAMIWERFGRFGLCFVCPTAGNRFFLLAFESAEKASEAVGAAGSFDYRDNRWRLATGIGIPRSAAATELRANRPSLTDLYGPGVKVFIYRLPFWLSKVDLELCLRALTGVTRVKVLWSSLNAQASSVGVGYATAYLHGLAPENIPERVKVLAGDKSAHFYMRLADAKKPAAKKAAAHSDDIDSVQPSKDAAAPSPATADKVQPAVTADGQADGSLATVAALGPVDLAVGPSEEPPSGEPSAAPPTTTSTADPQPPTPKRAAGDLEVPASRQRPAVDTTGENETWTTVGRGEKRPPSRPVSPSSPRTAHPSVRSGYYDVLAASAQAGQQDPSLTDQQEPPARKLAALATADEDDMDMEASGPAAWQPTGPSA